MDVVWTAIILFLIAIFSGSGSGGKNSQNNRPKYQANNASIEQPALKLELKEKDKDKPPTSVPTPALLPGLVGLGVAALRKRKLAKNETSV